MSLRLRIVKLRRQHFQGDLPLEHGIRGAIDLAHTADAELTGDLVHADTRTRREGHGNRRNYRRARLGTLPRRPRSPVLKEEAA